jgi:8-oxo-dGTP pyrophosphatase MutT (NUDIX family)
MENAGAVWNGAYICVFNQDCSKILLLKRSGGKHGRQRGKWGNVGGSIEPGESPVKACVREAKEETGISLRPEDLVSVCVKRTPESGQPKFAVHFYAASIDENTRIVLSDESDGCEWCDVDNLPERMLDSKKDILSYRAFAKRAFAMKNGGN